MSRGRSLVEGLSAAYIPIFAGRHDSNILRVVLGNWHRKTWAIDRQMLFAGPCDDGFDLAPQI